MTHMSVRRLRLALWLCAVVGATAGAVQTMDVLPSFGWHGWLDDTLGIKNSYAQPGWQAVWVVNYLVPVLGLLLARNSDSTKHKIEAAFLGATATGFLLLAAQRRSIITALVIVVLGSRLKPRTKAKVALVGAVVSVTFFVAYNAIKSPYYEGDWRYYVRDGAVSLPHELRWLSSPLFYATSGFAAFDAYVRRPRQDPGETFIAAIDLLNKVGPTITKPTNILEHTYIPFPTNVYTYLRPFYGDFGAAGVILAPLFLGWLATWVYTRGKRERGVGWTLSTGVLGWCVCITFFSNHFVYMATLLMLATAVLVGLFVAWPRAVAVALHASGGMPARTVERGAGLMIPGRRRQEDQRRTVREERPERQITG